MTTTIQEQIEILQAYERGEEIEVCGRNTICDNWFIVRPNHQFDFMHNRYRIKTKRWRAEFDGAYYFVGAVGVRPCCETHCDIDNGRYELGNYFRTKEDAEEARDLVKECLIKFHEENGKEDYNQDNRSKS